MNTIAPRPKSSKVFTNDIEMNFRTPFGIDAFTENNIFYNLDPGLKDAEDRFILPFDKSPKQIKKYSQLRK